MPKTPPACEPPSAVSHPAAAALVCAVLAICTLVIYWQSFDFGWVDIDDRGYVGPDSGPVHLGLTWDGVRWAFTTGHLANWHPLTWLSLMLDRTIQPSGFGVFHITNTLLHALNACLLFGVLYRMTRALWLCAWVAALFAVHPARVESVAWISERKDVLSGAFWFLTIWAYIQYVARRSWMWYVTSLICFVLGLMAKPMLVTLPCVLLLLDFWPLQRFRAGNDEAIRFRNVLRSAPTLILEKLPHFILAAASSVVTTLVQIRGGAALDVPLKLRLANAAISYVRYVGMYLWPVDLAVIYPLPGIYGQPPWPTWMAASCAGAIGVATVLALLAWRRAPWLIVGWLWFLGTLVPVIGAFVYVGFQSIADRYTYIPYVGLFIALAWSMNAMCRRARSARFILAPLAIAVVAILASLSWHQVALWRDSETLFQHALAVTHNNYRLHAAYGNVLLALNRPADAEIQYQACVDLSPTTAGAFADLGSSQMNQNKMTSARRSFEKCLALDPGNATGEFGIGWILWGDGRHEEGLAMMRRAAARDPTRKEFQEGLRIATEAQSAR